MAAGEYVLYGAKGSGSASIEAALHLAGLPCRVVEAAQWLPESAYAELLKANPLGQIPTLVLPDGQVLTESAAILIHLGLVPNHFAKKAAEHFDLAGVRLWLWVAIGIGVLFLLVRVLEFASLNVRWDTNAAPSSGCSWACTPRTS